MHGLFIQQAHAMGYQALQLAAQGVRGELPSLPVIVALQAHQVTRENLVQRERAREPGLSANR